MIPGVRELIKRYGPDQSFNKKQADAAIVGQSFGRYAKRFRGTGQTNAYTPQDVLRELAKRGLFRAGLQLECPACLLKFWLPIDTIRTEIACEYCGHEFNITPQLMDHEWSYRRTGLFGRGEEAIGGIAVCLVLRQLARKHHGQNMVYDTSLNLEGQGICIPTCKTDFAILQGDAETDLHLVIGECKTNGQIQQADVDNLVAVARLFQGSPIRVFVVFAKLSSFTDDEIARLRNAKQTQHHDIILLSERELEADLIYEWTHDELKQYISGVGLDGLVKGTEIIYFGGN